MQVAPGAQVRGVPSARGYSGISPLRDLGLRHFPGRREAGGGRPAGAPMGCGGAQKTRATLPVSPWDATGTAALRAVKGEGPASPGAAVCPPSLAGEMPGNHLHSMLISNKEESTKSYRNNLSSLIKQQLLIQYK